MKINKIFSILILCIGALIGSIVYLTSDVVPDQFIYLPTIVLSFLLLISGFIDNNSKKLSLILVSVSTLRFLIMLWNVYGREIYLLLGVGTDTEGFFRAASMISMDLSLLSKRMYGSYYSKYLGIIYHFIGPSYLFGSYLNYLYSVFSVVILYKVLGEFVFISEKQKNQATFIYGIAPLFMIIGSSLRRESLIILFTMLSQLYIARWLRTSKLRYGFSALLFVLMGSVLHAGVIGLISGYILMLLFYEPRESRWRLRRNSAIVAVIIIAGIIIAFTQYKNVFLAKLLVADEESFLKAANRARGDSAYLTHLTVNSISDVIKNLPLKLFYFLCAPVPWDWRGISDIIAFVLDSMVYIVAGLHGIRSISMVKKMPVLFALSISILMTITIFAIGSQNAGTAMRHRMKVLGPMLIVMYLVKAYSSKEIGEREYSDKESSHFWRVEGRYE